MGSLNATRRAANNRVPLLLSNFPRYNQSVLVPRLHSRFAFAALSAVAAFWAVGCVAPLGPGYTIERQRVQVRFESAPEPRIRIDAEYQLKNTGNRPLGELELRLPGRRRFHFDEPRAAWDATTLTTAISTENPRNALITLPQPWTTSARHTLHLSLEYLPAAAGETTLGFSGDAFFLPGQGWNPELLPARGLFATGGAPPKKWDLLVSVPEGFLMHTSGREQKTMRRGGELNVLAEQRASDRYPFVTAGRYSAAQIGGGKEKIHLWTHQPQEAARLRQESEGLARTMEAYDAAFGERRKEFSQTWIVECPTAAGCFTSFHASTAALVGDDSKGPVSAEMISKDTLLVDLSGGALKLASAAAPSLAASWLGYAESPAFYEQEAPLSLFPAFAASIGREAAKGADSRAETIRRVLRLIPASAPSHQAEDPAVVRAKSFLFFYALQDRYGHEAFRKATSHMLNARRGRGFELSDLIAAFDQETHQDAAEFVRSWMKHPGVPEEFRARYGDTAPATAPSDKETAP